MTNQEILINFNIEGYLKEMYFPEETIIEDVLTQFLKKTNLKINLSPIYITFTSGGKLLNSSKFINRNLSSVIRSGAFVNVYFKKEPHYAGDVIEFCDVSNGKKELINSNIIYGTPGKGINIYGYCQNYSCIAYNKEVVIHINKNYFDLLYEKHDLKCPKCNNIIIPNTVGFLQCEYKVKGKKYEGGEEFNFKEMADKLGKIKYYNSKENINGENIIG